MDIKFIPSPNYFTGRRSKTVTHVVIHAMAGFYRPTIDRFQNRASKVSAHYCVSLHGETVQMVHEQDEAWHACNANPFTIGIEHEDGNLCLKNGHWITAELWDASTKLTADICHRHSIPVANIIGHNDPLMRKYGNNHACPGPFVDFNKYRADVTSILASLKSS